MSFLHLYKLTYPDGQYRVESYDGYYMSPKEAMEKMGISLKGDQYGNPYLSYKYKGVPSSSEQYKQWYHKKDIDYSNTEAWDEVFGTNEKGKKMADGGMAKGGMALSNDEIMQNIEFEDDTDRKFGRYNFSFDTIDSEGAAILDYDGYIIVQPALSRQDDEIEWGQNVPEDWEKSEDILIDAFYDWKKQKNGNWRQIKSVLAEYKKHIDKDYKDSIVRFKNDKSMLEMFEKDKANHYSVMEYMEGGLWSGAYHEWRGMDTASREEITNEAYELLMAKNGYSTYAKGGAMEYFDIKLRVVRAIGIDRAIRFYNIGETLSISPESLIRRAVSGNFITLDEITKDVVESAMRVSEDVTEIYRDSGHGISSSDFTSFLREFLRDANFNVDFVGNTLKRLN